MSSNIGPNFNNKINGRPNPFSNGAKTSTYTRALGSTSIFAAGPGGWRGAARGANPYDTQSMNAARYARMRAGVNVYAGRNIGSFGALAHQSGANDMSGLEKAMMYTQLGMMAASVVNEIAGMFGSGKSEKAAPATVADPATVNPTKGNGKAGKTSTEIASELKGVTDSLNSSVDAVNGLKSNLDAISALPTSNIEALKNTGISDLKLDLNIDISGIKGFTINKEEPDTKELSNQAKLVKDTLSKATQGQGNLDVFDAKVTAQLTSVQGNINTLKLQIATAQANSQDVSALETQLNEAQAKELQLLNLQKTVTNARSELKTITDQLNAVNTTLQKEVAELPGLVERQENLKKEQKEAEQAENKQLNDLIKDANKLCTSIGTQNIGKVKKSFEELKIMKAQISSLKTTVAAHTIESNDTSAVDGTLAKIDQILSSSTTEVSASSELQAQLARLESETGLKVGEKITIGGETFELTKDGKMLRNDEEAATLADFKAAYEVAGKKDPAQVYQLTKGQETTIGNETFEITENGEFKVGGAKVDEGAFNAAINAARKTSSGGIGIDFSNFNPTQAMEVMNIIRSASGANGTVVVDGDNQSRSVKIENPNSDNPTYYIDGQQTTKDEFMTFIADKKLQA